VNRVRRVLAILLLAAVPALAQEGPAVDFGEVTITGTRVIKLPPARKGEVVDSSVYVLPAKDTMLFGERISNFGGPGGTLPGYREFDRPMSAHAEASFGTYLSPRLMAHAEYNERTLDAMATADYRGTAGHVDSAEASSLAFDVRGGVLLGGDDPSAPRVRITAGVDRIGDSYFLYGNRSTPSDRSRAALRVAAALESAQDALVDYDLFFHLEHTSVDDALGDSIASASASTPGFGAHVSAGDDTLRGRIGVDYQIASLQYGRSAKTPNWVEAKAELEWRASPSLLLTPGIVYSGAQYQDSGSTTLLLPRLAARYEASPELSLFAWYAPELRAPSYRNRIMRSPYVDRQIVIDPERVPISIAAGARFGSASTTLEGRVLFETAERTPVVAADSAMKGMLRYRQVDSRTLELRASLGAELADRLGALIEARVRSAVDDATDEQLPMTPQMELAVRADYALASAITLQASARLVSSQRVALERDSREIPSHLIVDAGATWSPTNALAIVAEITNLLSTSYELWDGYSAPGAELRGGVRLTF
jgi:outer membrane receptor protein involved in Fe transport